MAVVVAFFICWAPFHAQRLLAVYGEGSRGESPSDAMVTVYHTLTYTSGVLYYLSTTVNPVLYHIMSHKFREAFKVNLLIHMACVFTGSIHALAAFPIAGFDRFSPYRAVSKIHFGRKAKHFTLSVLKSLEIKYSLWAERRIILVLNLVVTYLLTHSMEQSPS